MAPKANFENPKLKELAQVRLQSGYCAQLAGKRQECQSAYSLVMDTSVDALVTALASHNLGTIDQKDARKKMKPLQATGSNLIIES